MCHKEGPWEEEEGIKDKTCKCDFAKVMLLYASEKLYRMSQKQKTVTFLNSSSCDSFFQYASQPQSMTQIKNLKAFPFMELTTNLDMVLEWKIPLKLYSDISAEPDL